METVKTAGLGDLDFGCEPLSKIFQHNAIRGGKESKNVLDEMSLVLCEFFPILDILSEVDLLSSPECGLLVLVHSPYVVILNREEYKAVGVFL